MFYKNILTTICILLLLSSLTFAQSTTTITNSNEAYYRYYAPQHVDRICDIKLNTGEKLFGQITRTNSQELEIFQSTGSRIIAYKQITSLKEIEPPTSKSQKFKQGLYLAAFAPLIPPFLILCTITYRND